MLKRYNFIIKESFFDTLVRSIIPKSIQDKVDANAKKYYDKKIKKIDKEIADLEKKQKKLSKDISKSLEKQYGIKMSDKELRDYWKKQIYGD